MATKCSLTNMIPFTATSKRTMPESKFLSTGHTNDRYGPATSLAHSEARPPFLNFDAVYDGSTDAQVGCAIFERTQSTRGTTGRMGTVSSAVEEIVYRGEYDAG
jgi:hypothetical protein